MDNMQAQSRPPSTMVALHMWPYVYIFISYNLNIFQALRIPCQNSAGVLWILMHRIVAVNFRFFRGDVSASHQFDILFKWKENEIHRRTCFFFALWAEEPRYFGRQNRVMYCLGSWSTGAVSIESCFFLLEIVWCHWTWIRISLTDFGCQKPSFF